MSEQDPEQRIGIYRKYDVKRRSDPGGKHIICDFFVLDLTHDRYASAALLAYATACSGRYPLLAEDLKRIANVPRADKAPEEGK